MVNCHGQWEKTAASWTLEKIDCLQQKDKYSSSKKGMCEPDRGCRTIIGGTMLGCTGRVWGRCWCFSPIYKQYSDRKTQVCSTTLLFLTSDTEDGQNCGNIGRRGSWKYGWVFLCSPDEKVVAELVTPLQINEMCNNTDTFLSRTGLSQCSGSQGCGSVLYYSSAEFSEFTQQFRKLRGSCLTAQACFLPLHHQFLSYCELQNRARELEKQRARTSESAWHLCSLTYISCFGKVAPADNLHQPIIVLNSTVFPQLSQFCPFHFKTRISQVPLSDIKQVITAPFTHPLPVRKVKTLE